MRVVIQRVVEASVKVDAAFVGKIGKGIVIFFAVHKEDKPEDTTWLVQKLTQLRLFSDPQGKMNLSLKEVQGGALVVSQFTLYANCREGRRPDFTQSAPVQIAKPIYEKFVKEMEQALGNIQTGVFGAYMEVNLINDGPVTFVIDAPFTGTKG